MSDEALLATLGAAGAPLLGYGGEARVYALDDAHVLRLLHPGGTVAGLTERYALVAELAAAAPPFGLPEALEVGERAGRVYSVERRLPGRSVLELLGPPARPGRDRLVEGYLDAVAALRTLRLRPRPWFGDLVGAEPVRRATWAEFLVARAEAGLRRAPAAFAGVRAERLAAALPASHTAAFVHLDAYPGNVLAHGTTVTAVIDIGPTSVVGDPRLDPVSAVVYLSAPQITPTATARDAAVAHAWLRGRGLAELYEPVRRWLAAYWSWAVDDTKLQAWCREVLLA